MKSILLIRHAKTVSTFLGINDFERPLTEDGEKDAQYMAKKLVIKEINIEGVITSTAVRALTTANYFAEIFKIEKRNFIECAELYHSKVQTFVSQIEGMDNTIKSVAIFSHNPGITQFANTLTEAKIDNMPPCSIFGINLKTQNWAEFNIAEKEFWFFDCPNRIW